MIRDGMLNQVFTEHQSRLCGPSAAYERQGLLRQDKRTSVRTAEGAVQAVDAVRFISILSMDSFLYPLLRNLVTEVSVLPGPAVIQSQRNTQRSTLIIN